MKTRYVLALAGLLLVPTMQASAADAAAKPGAPAAAAPAPGPGMMGHGPMMMDDDAIEDPATQDRLKLTAEQKQKIKAIQQESRTKREALRKETHDKIAQVLTPEQQKAFEERREQHMEKRMDRMDRRDERMQKRMDRMKERQQGGGAN